MFNKRCSTNFVRFSFYILVTTLWFIKRTS